MYAFCEQKCSHFASYSVGMSDVLPASTNPFVYARALLPEESIPRETEIEGLITTVAGGHNAVLHAPRRFGKTTLLKHVLQRATELDMPGVLIDLGNVLSVADVAVRLDQAFRALPGATHRLIVKELTSIGLTTPLGGVNFARGSGPDPIGAVHGLLELPATIAERRGRRVLVVLDEFQALVALDGMDGVFRSHIQHHANVSYLFAGSEPSLLKALFEDRARPFYGQVEPRRLGRLGLEETFDFLTQRFVETQREVAPEVAAELARLTEGHPQRMMLLAHMLWARTDTRTTATMSELRGAYGATMQAVGPELGFLWDSLSTNERRVLASLASGVSPFTVQAQRLTSLAGRSSAARSVAQLEQRSLIERDGTLDGLSIVDPLFGRWVRLHGGAHEQIFVFPHEGGFAVAEGASLAFVRSTYATLAEAEDQADALASRSAGSEVMIYDTDDPNDLPVWALTRGGQ
jgi:hypothetical protein